MSNKHIYRTLLNNEELVKLRHNLEDDGDIIKHSYTRGDGHGRESRMCLWNHPGDDITGMIGRCEKVVTTTEEVCYTHCLIISLYVHSVTRW